MIKTIRTRLYALAALAAIALCTAESASSQEQFSRDLEQVTFVPKGQFIAGLSASYGQNKFNNFQYLIVENITGNDYSLKVSPMLMYAFKDDLALGGRVAYSRGRTKLASTDVVLSSDETIDLNDLYVETQNYSTTALFRNYMSLGRSKRFGIVNELGLQYSHGESKLSEGIGKDHTGSFQRTNSISLQFSPGIMVFLNNYSAFEVNVGVLELGYTHSKQINDVIHTTSTKAKTAKLQVNLFSVSFGVAFYL